MRQISILCIIIGILAPTQSFVSNPFTGSFQTPTQTINSIPTGSFPNFTSANFTQQTTSNTFQAPAQVTAPTPSLPSFTSIPVSQTPTPAPAPHFHTPPVYNPSPIPSAPLAHSHGPQVPQPRAPVAGFPHMHSGHPYIAPAVPARNMTYQQIIEYLIGSDGVGLTNVLRNGSGNFLTQCKAYCNMLPPNPTCDSTMVLYRNKCEARCIHKTVTEENLRYGMCCCSDDDFNYELSGNMFVTSSSINNPRQNICVSKCIFNCLGGSSALESEHSDVELVMGRSGTFCGSIQ